MNSTVSCPSCDTSFPVDPTKVPAEGVRAQCSSCPEIFDVNPSSIATAEAPPAGVVEPDTVDLPPLEGSFEGAEAAEQVEASEPEAAPAEPEAEAAAPPAEAEAPATEDAEPIRFGRRSPEDKAKSLARSLVSDLIAYNPEKHKEALAAGTLQEIFGEEIEKSFKEYQEQVEPDVISKGSFFNDALNAILAEGQSVFSVDG